jgi:superfamily II DNA helicase RecQ
MRLHFVTVPIHGSSAAEQELNQFLATHRILSVDRQLVADGPRSAWAVCVTYVDAAAPAPALDAQGKRRVDYRELLSDADFQVFARLRDLRKRLAERDGVPPYALFTNEQLAEMVRHRACSAADLQRIDGVGPARVEKYGAAFLDVLHALPTPAPREVPASAPVLERALVDDTFASRPGKGTLAAVWRAQEHLR